MDVIYSWFGLSKVEEDGEDENDENLDISE